MTTDATAALEALQRFGDARPRERCDSCGAAVTASHAHLYDAATRAVACACSTCARAAASEGPGPRRIPEGARTVPPEALDASWAALEIPIGLAAFVRRDDDGVLALFPSPAGLTESPLPASRWRDIAGRSPQLASMQREVEALLVDRRVPRRVHLVVGIDECFRIAGLVRRHWRGLTGGAELWRVVDARLGELQARAEGLLP